LQRDNMRLVERIRIKKNQNFRKLDLLF